MIKNQVRSYLINILAIWIVSSYTGGLHLAEGLKSLLLVAAAFSAIHLFIRPIFSLVLGPLNFFTLGFVGLIIDSLLLFGLTKYLPEIWITPWHFGGTVINGLIVPAIDFNLITATILSALIINIIRQVLSALIS